MFAGALLGPSLIVLFHENARLHVSIATQDKIEEVGWEVLPHAPHSPDLAPSDYHLFMSMEHYLRDVKFQNVEHIKKWVGDYFEMQPPEFYSDGIRKLRERWRNTIATTGDYWID